MHAVAFYFLTLFLSSCVAQNAPKQSCFSRCERGCKSPKKSDVRSCGNADCWSSCSPESENQVKNIRNISTQSPYNFRLTWNADTNSQFVVRCTESQVSSYYLAQETTFFYERKQLCGEIVCDFSPVDSDGGLGKWQSIDISQPKPIFSRTLKEMKRTNLTDSVNVTFKYEIPAGWKQEDFELQPHVQRPNCDGNYNPDILFDTIKPYVYVNFRSISRQCSVAIIMKGYKLICSNETFEGGVYPSTMIYDMENLFPQNFPKACAPSWNSMELKSERFADDCVKNTTSLRLNFNETNPSETQEVCEDLQWVYVEVCLNASNKYRSCPEDSLVKLKAPKTDSDSTETTIYSVIVPDVPFGIKYLIRHTAIHSSDISVSNAATTVAYLKAWTYADLVDLRQFECRYDRLPEPERNWNVILYISLAVIGVLIVSIVVFCIFSKRRRAKSAKKLGIFKDTVRTGNSRYVAFPEKPFVQDKFELDHRRLIVKEDEQLGKGAFGKVFKGKISGRVFTSSYAKSPLTNEQELADDLIVAVKQCYEFADDQTKQDFIQEIKLMKKLYYHPCLVNILHCITANEPYSLIVEYCDNGDLLHFLRSSAKYMLKLQEQGIDLSESTPDDFDDTKVVFFSDVVRMGFEVSDGMEYLSQKGFIHRDLAARNVMVDTHKHVKIGDFGLCRYIYSDNSVYMAKGGKLPIKWMAIESITNYEFTTKSDVWSYGVLLFEIVTLGAQPYADVMPLDGDFRQGMIDHLHAGNRLEQPVSCPEEIYDVMQSTWAAEPEKRSDFTAIKESMRKLVEAMESTEGGLYGDRYVDVSQTYYSGARPVDPTGSAGYTGLDPTQLMSIEETGPQLLTTEETASPVRDGFVRPSLQSEDSAFPDTWSSSERSDTKLVKRIDSVESGFDDAEFAEPRYTTLKEFKPGLNGINENCGFDEIQIDSENDEEVADC